jgi:hypothetical protein
VHHEREDRRIQREVGREQQHQQQRQREREVAELPHHGRGPVDGAHEVGEAGGEPEGKRADRSRARGRTMPALEEAEQQGRERDPRDGGMAEAREAEGQQDPGQEG